MSLAIASFLYTVEVSWQPIF